MCIQSGLGIYAYVHVLLSLVLLYSYVAKREEYRRRKRGEENRKDGEGLANNHEVAFQARLCMYVSFISSFVLFHIAI